MQHLPEEHRSLWISTTPETDHRHLAEGLDLDVAVIGGGIAGITTAHLLQEEGLTVAVIEANQIVKGVTGHTTAKITSLHGLIYNYLISTFGEEQAQRYADANQAAITKMANIADEHSIDCDFQEKPAYTYTRSAKQVSDIEQEVDAAKTLGLPATYVEETSLPFPIDGAVRFDEQAQFHPRKYLLELAKQVAEDGYVFEKTRARDIDGTTVRTNRGTITAEHVVMATHYPFKDTGHYFARMYPKYSYVLGLRTEEELPDGMFYSTEDPFHSMRTHSTPEEDLLLLGGQNHKTGQGGDNWERYQNLAEFAEEHFSVEAVPYRWATQDYVPMDRVPYIGEVRDNLYLATGFKGWGITHGTVAGMLIRDLIMDRENSWAALYDPDRLKPSASAKRFAKENMDAAKCFVKDRFTESEVDDVSDIPPGGGAVVKVDGDKVAMYRDSQGKLHAHSAICPHMQCVLRWNNAEHTWDCPCHGSRFEATGEVIDGPAQTDLPEKDAE